VKQEGVAVDHGDRFQPRSTRIEIHVAPTQPAVIAHDKRRVVDLDVRVDVADRDQLEFPAPGEWQTVSVSFDKLSPAIFGRPIHDLPFRKHLVTRMGLLNSDRVDGPFRLEIDWIDLCPR